MAHAGRKVIENIVNGDSQASNAWFAAAFARFDRDDLGIIHRRMLCRASLQVNWTRREDKSLPDAERGEDFAEEFLGVEAAGDLAHGIQSGAKLKGNELRGNGPFEGLTGRVQEAGGGFEAGLVPGVDGDHEIIRAPRAAHGGVEDALGECVEALAGLA